MNDSNGYRKDSMDRFGDDLTEDILSYLWFEDKVRLECVSKQWRRLVFNKQFAIEFNYYESKHNLRRLVRICHPIAILKRQELESILKKCPNITNVNIGFTNICNKELSLFGQYCPRLKSLRFCVRGEEDLDFGRQYGHKLEELDLMGNDQDKFLRLCPNLKNLCFNKYYFPFTDFLNKEFLPKVEYFGKYPSISFDRISELKILSDKYSKTMKSLNFDFMDVIRITAEELKTCFNCISWFEHLKELKLEFRYWYELEPIDDCLSLIGQKCNKLLKLDLKIITNFAISDRFFASFSQFKAIKKLKIDLFDNELSGSIECFKHCKQLIELDINYRELREDFFANIASFVPKLQSLRIKTRNQFSDSFIDSFQQMKNIQLINYSVTDGYNKVIYTKNWYFGKSVSEVMLSPNGMNVKHINDNYGLIIHEEYN